MMEPQDMAAIIDEGTNFVEHRNCAISNKVDKMQEMKVKLERTTEEIDHLKDEILRN